MAAATSTLSIVVGANVKEAEENLGKLSGAFQSMGKAAAGLAVGAVAGVGALAAGIGKLAMDASKVVQVKEGFSSFAESVGVDAAQAMDRMREATKGLVTDSDLMQTANKALAGSTDAVKNAYFEALPGIQEFALRMSQVQGIPLDITLEKFITGLKRMSPMLIDDTGLTLKLSEVTDKAAQMFGMAAGKVIDNSEAMAQAKIKIGDLQQQIQLAQMRMGEFTDKTKASARAAAEFSLEKLNRELAEQQGELSKLAAAHGKMGAAAEMTADSFSKEQQQLALIALIQEKMGPQMEALGGIQLGLGERVKQATVMFENAKQTIGEAFIPVVMAVAETALPLIQSALVKVVPAAQQFAVWLGKALPEAIGIAQEFFSSLQPFIAPVVSGFQILAKAVSLLAEGDIGSFHDVIVDLVGVPLGDWLGDAVIRISDFAGKIGEAVSKVGEFGQAAVTWITGTAIPAIQGLVGTIDWAAIGTAIGDVAAKVGEFGQAAVTWITGTAVPKFQELVGNIDWPRITGALGELGTKVADFGGKVQTWIAETAVPKFQELVENIDWPRITGALGELGTKVADFGGKVQTWIAETAVPKFQELVGAIDWAAMASNIGNVGDTIREKFGGIDWGGIKEGLGGVVGKLAEFYGPTWERLKEALGGLRGQFEELVPKLDALWQSLEPVVAVLAGLAAIVVKVAAEFAVAMLASVLTAIGGAADVLRGAIELLKSLFEGFVALIKGDVAGQAKALEGIVTSLGTIFNGLATIVGTALGTIWDTISNTVNDLLSTNLPDWESFKEQVVTVFTNLWTAITTKCDEIATTIETKVTALPGLISEKVDSFLQAGKDIIQGVIDGIGAKWEDIKAKITELANALPQWMKDILRIKSPSEAMAEIGQMLMAGLDLGIGKGEAEVLKRLAQVMKKIGEALQVMTAGLQAIMTWGPVADFKERVARLIADVREVMVQLVQMAWDFQAAGNEWLVFEKAAATIGDIMGRAVDWIKAGVENLGALKDYASPARATIDAFVADMKYMIQALVQNIGTDVVTEAQVKYAELTSSLIGLVAGVVDNLEKLAAFKGGLEANAANVTELMVALRDMGYAILIAIPDVTSQRAIDELKAAWLGFEAGLVSTLAGVIDDVKKIAGLEGGLTASTATVTNLMMTLRKVGYAILMAIPDVTRYWPEAQRAVDELKAAWLQFEAGLVGTMAGVIDNVAKIAGFQGGLTVSMANVTNLLTTLGNVANTILIYVGPVAQKFDEAGAPLDALKAAWLQFEAGLVGTMAGVIDNVAKIAGFQGELAIAQDTITNLVTVLEGLADTILSNLDIAGRFDEAGNFVDALKVKWAEIAAGLVSTFAGVIDNVKKIAGFEGDLAVSETVIANLVTQLGRLADTILSNLDIAGRFDEAGNFVDALKVKWAEIAAGLIGLFAQAAADLATLATTVIPDTEVAYTQIEAAMRATWDVMSRLANELLPDWDDVAKSQLEKIQAFSSILSAVFEPLNAALGFLKQAAEAQFPEVAVAYDKIEAACRTAYEVMQRLANEFLPQWTEAAKAQLEKITAFSGTLQALFAPLNSCLDFLNKLADAQFPNIDKAMKKIGAAIQAAYITMETLANELIPGWDEAGKAMLDKLNSFSEAISGIFNALSSVTDTIAKILALDLNVEKFEIKMGRIKKLVEYTIEQISGVVVPEESETIAASVRDLFSILSSVCDYIQDILGLDFNVVAFQNKINELKTAIIYVIQQLGALGSSEGADVAVRAVADALEVLAANIQAMNNLTLADLIAGLGDLLIAGQAAATGFASAWQGVMQDMVSSAIQAVNAIIAALNAIPRDITVTMHIVQEGEIPGYQFGGIVPGPRGMPQLAVVHGGERIVSTGGTASAAAWDRGTARNLAREFAAEIERRGLLGAGVTLNIQTQEPAPIAREVERTMRRLRIEEELNASRG